MNHHVTPYGNLVINTEGEQIIVNPLSGTNLVRLTLSSKEGTTQETFRVGMSEFAMGKFGMGFETNEPFERADPTHRLINASEMRLVFSGSAEECREMLGNVNDPDEHFIEEIQ